MVAKEAGTMTRRQHEQVQESALVRVSHLLLSTIS